MQIHWLAPATLAVALMTGSILRATPAGADPGTIRARNDGRPLAPVLLSVEVVSEESDASAVKTSDRAAGADAIPDSPERGDRSDPPRPRPGVE